MTLGCLVTFLSNAPSFPLQSATDTAADWHRDLIQRTILVLGLPRSGTSWLAKIIDSHPDILYRHEPDEAAGVYPQPNAQLIAWLRQNDLRTAGKRPWFHKSWRPWPLEMLWRGNATALAARQRFLHGQADCLPDLTTPWLRHRIRLAMKLVNWDASATLAALPHMRALFILRHPCGQIASTRAGERTGRFNDGTLTQTALLAGRAYAARFGIDPPRWDRFPDWAQYAWAWRAFNEPVIETLRTLPNARIVIYEDLCRNPEAICRDLFRFLDLPWHPQTEAFLQASTRHSGPSGYYDVFRSARLAAERWRSTLAAAEQAAILGVVYASPLASCWEDDGS
jgi:hypothetical protein